jgi:DnaJ-class molecular chaperone
MKSKEQIEELVLEKFKHRMFNPFFNVAFVEGYMQCQEDMAHLSEWQLCPKCFGEGQVENVGTSSSVYRICPVCNGNKTLIKPHIK